MIAYLGTGVWPEAGTPDPREIAVGLGRMPRFAGQTKHWYPVLAHVQVVAALLPPGLQVHGLLHDAAESIVGDTPSTWKTREAKAAERRLLDRIYRDLGVLQPEHDDEELLLAADAAALHAEAHVLGHADPSWFDERWEWTPLTERAKALTTERLAFAQLYLDADHAMHVYGAALGHALDAWVAAGNTRTRKAAA